jgi:hypothetical protein
MSTDAYLRVRTKLQQTGREYLDGFSWHDFEGLSLQEYGEIVDSLKTRAAAGDGVSFAALEIVLSREELLEFAKDLLKLDACPTSLHHARLLTAIFGRTADEQVWRSLVNVLAQGDAAARLWALNNLQVENLSPQRMNELSVLLPKLINQERDEALLISLVADFLVTRRLVPKSSQYIQYAKRLRSPNLKERRAALMELGCKV